MSRSDLPHEAYLAAVASLHEVGPSRMRWLLSLGSPEEVWARIGRGALGSPPRRLGVSAELISAWRSAWRDSAPRDVWRRCEQLDVGVVSLGSPAYPPDLAADAEPPVVLFHRGDPGALAARPRVAVVGARRATGYGLRVATQMGRDLSAAGVAVVSGLALGIDAAAHRGVVAAETAETSEAAPPIAVVGAGLDSPCPARNRDLARQLVERGVVVSEVPPGVGATRWRFPVRNRILAALADVVVVVESTGRGGSMHTVRAALDRDRQVMAVPGPVDSLVSEGPNELLVDGAAPARDADDVLVALGHARPPSSPTDQQHRSPGARRSPSGPAVALLDLIGWRPVSLDELCRRSGLGFGELGMALAVLETDGWVVQRGGWVERVAEGNGGRRARP